MNHRLDAWEMGAAIVTLTWWSPRCGCRPSRWGQASSVCSWVWAGSLVLGNRLPRSIIARRHLCRRLVGR